MAAKPEFKYFHGNEADRYTFYRIPKILFTCSYFASLSTDAKLLYGLMLDRMSLSTKNQWMDSENRVVIYFSQEDICEMLHCGKGKATAIVKELDAETGIGLIERKRQGQGREICRSAEGQVYQDKDIYRCYRHRILVCIEKCICHRCWYLLWFEIRR